MPGWLRLKEGNYGGYAVHLASHEPSKAWRIILCGWFLVDRVRRIAQTSGLQKPIGNQTLPANSLVSVDTLIFSPSLMKKGTRISTPVSNLAGLVTLPLAVSPRTPGSV